MNFNGQFDATQIAPQQVGGKHPVGQFPAEISDTFSRKNKNTEGGQLVVEFKTPVGAIQKSYNLWNNSTQAVEIAMKELSALCWATGRLQLDMTNADEKQHAMQLRGARCVIKVDLQDNSKPDGYVEVSRVFDAQGNEPKAHGGGAPATQPQSGGFGGQPQPNAGSGGFGAQGAQPNQPQPNTGGFQAQPQQNSGFTAQPNQQQPQAQQPANNGGGAPAPPWAR